MTDLATICHINVAKGFRGGERQTELLIRQLDSRGYRQILVCRENAALGQRFAGVDLDIRPVSGHIIGVTRATLGADILHVHEGRSVYAAWWRHCRSNTPYVITRRVDNPISDHWLAHRAYRSAACVAGVAPQVTEIVRQFDPDIRTATVHSGSSGFILNEVEAQKIRRRWPGKFVVGHVGALDNDQKGQEHIITVARRLELTETDLQFVLVGSGGDELMLKTMATGLSNITFTGFVENVGDYLAAFDLFILPSNREGVGSILFDAMERELPVIASRVGGVPDIVHDGENGLLIGNADPDQLQHAILKLKGDSVMSARMGQRGRQIARQFTAAAMGDKYEKIYAEARLAGTGKSV